MLSHAAVQRLFLFAVSSRIVTASVHRTAVRAKVEHVFGIVKGLFGFRKTRYSIIRQEQRIRQLRKVQNIKL